MNAVQRFSVLAICLVGLSLTSLAVSFWNIPALVGFTLTTVFSAVGGYYLLRIQRTYHARRQKIQALRIRAKKITSSAHQFIVDRIVDLRQPLQGLVSIQDLYRSENVPKETREYLEIADFCSRFIIRQLERIQFFAEVENQTITFAPKNFSLRHCVHAAISIAREQANFRTAKIVDEWSPYIPDSVEGQEPAIKKLLVELLDNSLRFSGGHDVILRILPDPDDNRRVRFVVTDSGPGLSDQQLELLRRPLPTHKKAIPWADAREGMGFILIKKLLQSQNAQLVVESQKGMGTTFSMIFPVESLHVAKQLNHQVLRNGAAVRALVVDDEPIARQVICGLLKKLGVATEIAENGQQAVDKAQNGQFDIIFMDIEMPILDGLEASKLILKNLTNKKSPPIVALSSHYKQAEREACAAIGIGEFLSKPANLDGLNECFKRLGFSLSTDRAIHEKIAADVSNIVNLEEERRKRGSKKPKERGQYVDFQRLFQSLDENMTLCTDVLRQVSHGLEVDLERLATEMKSDNRDEIRKILNKIYGELTMILCEPGIKAVQSMETAARTPGRETLHNSFEKLSDLFEDILMEIDQFVEHESQSA